MNKSLSKKITHYLDFFAFTLPALLCVVIVTNIPFILNMYYSVFEWNGISKTKVFVGLDNFIRIFTSDKSFVKSLIFTGKFTVIFVIAINVVAIITAYALANNAKIGYLFRSFYFAPYIISLVAISLIWKCILGPGFSNLFESTNFSVFGLSWLGSSTLVFYTVVFVAVWQNIGFYMVIYIAGFTSIPTDVMEAASIDGANGFQKLMKIQLPLLMPSITIAVFTSLTYAFKLFDIVLVLTKGGPAGSTTTIAYDIYAEAFASGRYGAATAKSLVFFVIVLAITVIQLKISKSREVEY